MCEFKVFLGGEVIFEDVIYASQEGSNVVLVDILGEKKVVSSCIIAEVDVRRERLVLKKPS